MQFSPLILTAAIAATGVDAIVPRAMTTGYSNTTAYIHQTVTAYVTYCPSPTKFVEGTKTYTITQETWATVTVCPGYCTISNIAGAKPTVVPIGVFPKYTNTTTPVPVCPETDKSGVPCPPRGENGAGNDTDNFVPGADGPNSVAPPDDVPGSDGSSSGSGGAGSDSGPTPLTGTAGKVAASSAALAVFAGCVFFAL